ncbi:MAG: DUF4236 domain-containing protein, partial [Cyclonatronaceae bacterium]
MPFYVRKSLSFGPIRFNLSKSGVGVSAGVTGARVGLNKQGAYFHGGRHGLYYREKLGKKKRSGAGQQQDRGQDTVELFTDTGQTYTHAAKHHRAAEYEENAKAPLTADVKSAAYPFYIAALSILIAAIAVQSLWLFFTSLLFAILGPVYRRRKRAAGEKTLQEIDATLETLDESAQPVKTLEELLERPLPQAFIALRAERIAVAALLLYIDSGAHFDRPALKELLSRLPIDEARLKAHKVAIFDELLEDFMADHVMTEEEEQQLEQLIADFELRDDEIAAQRHLMKQLVGLRNAMQAGFEPANCPLKLTRGEICYYAVEGKQLKKRVLDSFQRDGVRYKKVGYETDKAGMIYLTNKQIYIVDDGVRSIRLNTILD